MIAAVRHAKKKGATSSPFYKATRRAARSFEPRVKAAFLGVVSRLQDQMDMDRLVMALNGGSLSMIESAAGVGNISSLIHGDRDLRRAFLGAATATGMASAEILSELLGSPPQVVQALAAQSNGDGPDFGHEFNAFHPDVVRAAREQAGNLAVGVSDEARATIRSVVSRGAGEGLTPAKQAREIRQVVGLPSNWANAPANFAQELHAGRFDSSRRFSAADKATIRRHLREGTVTPEFVDRMQGRYSQGLTNARAQSIARTESSRAAHTGLTEDWAQAQEEGVIPPSARAFWIVTVDERLAHWMVPGMNSGGRPIGQMFSTPEGQVRHPPSRARCRCSLGLAIGGEEDIPDQSVMAFDSGEVDVAFGEYYAQAPGWGAPRPENLLYDELRRVEGIDDQLDRFNRALMVHADMGTGGGTLSSRGHMLLTEWNSTSGDSSPIALAMQITAQQEFSLSGAAMNHLAKAAGAPGSPAALAAGKALAQGKALARDGGAFIASTLRAQHNMTQAWFSSRGIKNVPVARGVRALPAPVGVTELELQPLSSFSVNAGTAANFGNHVYLANVPVDRILSTAHTGMGVYGEGEFVVLGGRLNAVGLRADNAKEVYFEAKLLAEDVPGEKLQDLLDARVGERAGTQSVFDMAARVASGEIVP